MNTPARLPADAHRRLYLAQVLPDALAKTVPSSSPTAIITGGQPGAGKSRLVELAWAQLRQPNGCVVVDADIFRHVHPQYRAFLQQDPRTAADRTHADAGAWAAQLTRDAVQGRRDLVIDQTSRDPKALALLLEQLKAHGYRTEIRVMAVSYEVSLQRIHSRFEHQLQAGAAARFSSRHSHDHAYIGLVDTVRAAQASPHLDAIAIYDLHHREIHRGTARAGHGDHALSVFQRERDRPLTLSERRDLVAKWETIAAQLARPERRATADEVQAADEQRGIATRRLDALVFASMPRKQALLERPALSAAFAQLDEAMATIPREQRTEQRQREIFERVAHRILGEPVLARGQSLQAPGRDPDPER